MNGLCVENKLRDKSRRKKTSQEVIVGVQGANDGQAQGTLGKSDKNLPNFKCILKLDLQDLLTAWTKKSKEIQKSWMIKRGRKAVWNVNQAFNFRNTNLRWPLDIQSEIFTWQYIYIFINIVTYYDYLHMIILIYMNIQSRGQAGDIHP